MQLKHGIHLAYCTNIHRGETWAETMDALEKYTLAVKRAICPELPYAIGLRLGDQASRELVQGGNLDRFRDWMVENGCYVFTINGFPFGKFHGTRVKEQVYAPDWTSGERLDYTKRLFDILSQIIPPDVEGSVSTVPCSFKEFITAPAQVDAIVRNLWSCIDYLSELKERTGCTLHLGLEPEPLCYLETTGETVEFFKKIEQYRPGDGRWRQHLGVNYDACHLAVEFEEPAHALSHLLGNGIRISKLHFSSALKVRPSENVRAALTEFEDSVYFHQVVERSPEGYLRRFKDLPLALQQSQAGPGAEWRIHYHIPLHSQPAGFYEPTADHLLGVIEFLGRDPSICSHIEMETYTWEVLPPELKNRSVVEQLVQEYQWTLCELARRGLSQEPKG